MKKSLPSIGMASIATLAFGLLPTVGAANAAEKPVPPTNVTAENISLPEAAEAPSRFIVQFEDKAKGKSAERKKAYGKIANELGVSVKEVKSINTGSIVVEATDDLSASKTDAVVETLESQPQVQYVEEDILMQPAFTPNDTYYGNQWHLHESTASIKVPTVWDRTTGNGSVVAVIDSGILPHADLNSNLLPGYDMISSASNARDGDGRDSNPRDEGDYRISGDCNSTGTSNSSWHGLHVAGTIAATTNNGKGVAGVAPSAKIVPIRALGPCGGYMSDIADGITWASGGSVYGTTANANPADVINLSLSGNTSCSLTMQRTIDNANARGSVVVAAAGNENMDASHNTPANCNNVITVAASDRAGNKASYSNYGAAVDVTAPGGGSGGGVASTLNTGTTTPGSDTYAYYQGTSMATPHVSGIAALMVTADPSLTPAQVESRLKTTARALPGTCSVGCGAGLVDASKAVIFPVVERTPEPSPEPEPEPAPITITPTPEPEPEPAATPTIKEVGSTLAVDGNGVLWNYGNPIGERPRVKVGNGWHIMKDIHVVDWNQDGYQDIIAQAKDGKLYYYHGKKYGGFTRYHIGNGWGAYEINVAKWKKTDKYPSIVARHTTGGGLYIYPNNSGNALSSRFQIGSGWHIFNNLNVLDWDKDGGLDILGRTSSGDLKLYRTNGAGNWVWESRPTVGKGWNIFSSITTMQHYNGSQNPGLVGKTTDGKLRYYEIGQGKWLPRTLIGGAGWNPYFVASH